MDTSRNISLLYRYHFFTSIAFSVVANTIFLDQLMLKLNIDIGDFGMIKGAMFIIPALSYQLAIPFLRRLDQPELVCAYSYALRVLLPCLLPLMGIFGLSPKMLSISAMLILGVSCAMLSIASNSLLLIYRKTFPEERYNHFMGKIILLLNLPATLINLGVAWILQYCENCRGNTYLWIFFLLQVSTVLFEIPAFRAMRQVQREPRKAIRMAFNFRDYILPLRSPGYRNFLLFCLAFGLVLGITSTYFIVYLYNERHWSVMRVMFFGTLFSVISLVISFRGGKRFDRSTFPGLFAFFCGLIFIGTLATGFALDKVWGMIVAMLFIWNGWGSTLGAVLSTIIFSASGKLASKENTIFFISMYSLTINLGQFSGSVLAGYMLRMASRGLPEGIFNFQGFFRLSSLAAFLLFFFTFLWWRTHLRKKA